MSTDLSWFDKNIIPLTKGYRDFIRAKESTPPERWNRDGERKFTNQQKKFLKIYQNKNGKLAAMTIVPEAPVIPQPEKKTEIKNPELENQIAVGNENEIIVGKTTKYDLFGKVTEVKEFTSEESYLKAVQQQVGRTNFKNETLLRDPELLKKVDDLLVLDRKNIHPLEYYIEMVNKEVDQISAGKIPVAEELETVGKITSYDLFGKESEVKEYRAIEDYLSALEENVGSRINFKHETLLRDPELLKKVGDLILAPKNPYSLEYYTKMVETEKAADSIQVTSAYSQERTTIISAAMQREKEEVVGMLSFYDEHGQIGDMMKYTSNESYLKALSSSLDSLPMGSFKWDTLARDPELLKAVDDRVFGEYGDGNSKSLEYYIELVKNEEIFKGYEKVDGSVFYAPIEMINAISSEKLLELKSLKLYNVQDEMRSDNFSTIKNLRKDIDKIDEVLRERSKAEKVSAVSNRAEVSTFIQKDDEQLQHHKDQLKYLGFGNGEKLHEDLKSGIDSHQSSFELQAVAKKTQLGNTVNFALKYARIDQGDIVLNSYNGELTNGKGDQILQNFKVTKDNHFSAKEAINLLEGRAVKIEYTNPLTDLREQAFVKLNLSEEKNYSGNYNFQTFPQSYGVNTHQIVEKSNLVFDRPELRDKVINSLEKGDIVDVKISVENKLIQAKAVLNPQYKTLNLYDSEMNRINTNKPIQGMEQIQAQEKSNVRQQSLSRGI